jgi:hypothetical protein
MIEEGRVFLICKKEITMMFIESASCKYLNKRHVHITYSHNPIILIITNFLRTTQRCAKKLMK